MKVSRDSIRNLSRLYLGLNEPKYRFHQTLTFEVKQSDSKSAKTPLNKLLDLLHKTYVMGTVYVQHFQERGSVHYHVMFLFYDVANLPFPESQLETEFRKDVFNKWERITGEKLSRQGNLMRSYSGEPLQQRDFVKYVLKDAEVLQSGKGERWWYRRNARLIRAHSTLKDKATVKAYMRDLPPILKLRAAAQRTEPAPEKWNQRRLDHLHAYIEAGQKLDWKDFKKRETGRQTCSDADFIRFLNGQSLTPTRTRRPSRSKTATGKRNSQFEL